MSEPDNQNVLVLSSDDECTPSQASGKNAGPTKTINITIAETTPVNVAKSTKITIQIEDSDIESHSSNVAKAASSDEPRKKVRRVSLVPLPKKESEQQKENLSGFTTRYIEFMELCSCLDPSEDMKRVLERKVKTYYRKAGAEFVSSQEFDELLADAIRRLRSDVASMWVHIKSVVDALRSRKTYPLSAKEPGLEQIDPATAMEVHQLEKSLVQLQSEVQRLEEQEVDFEQENSSAYLLADSAKARLVRVHARLCSLRGERATRWGRVRLARREGRAAGPAARLEAWVNAPVADGRAPRFPDFHDVVECVRDAVAQDHLDWSQPQIMKEARELFVACGRELQRRRQRRDWRLAAAHLPRAPAPDPAAASAALRDALLANGRVARAREDHIFDKFENMEMVMKNGSKVKVVESKPKEEECDLNSRKISCPSQKHNDSNKILTLDQKQSDSSDIEYTTEFNDSAENNLLNMKEMRKTRKPSCETISSGNSYDEESDSSERSTEEIFELSDTDTVRFEVSDSDAGSDIDELKLLRRVQARGCYSTRVYDVHTDISAPLELSDGDSDSSGCVLVHSEDENSGPL